MDLIVRDIKEFTGPQTCKNYGGIADIKVDSAKGNAYERAVAHKDIIREVLAGRAEISDINDLVSQGIESMYSLDETNKAMLKKETANLTRYLSCEKRKPVFASLEAVDIKYENLAVAFKPDVLFVDDYNKTVEAVIYRSGSPTINERTWIKPDKLENMKEWFKLYIAKMYAKEYAEKKLVLNNGETYTAKGSFYFMKKNTDKEGAPRDNDFFSGSGANVCTYMDKYIYGAPAVPTEDDRLFLKFMDDCDTGLECTERDCESCMGRANCKYTKAPVKLEKKEIKKREKITPSEAQLAVIEAKKGIFKVNATAGSGKTECMTERTKRLIADGHSPKEILHISFTDAAVGEMKNRISGKCLTENINVKPEDIECYTFNAFANKAIGNYYKELGFTKAPAILTAEYELNTIEKLIDETPVPGIDPGSVTFANNSAIERVILIAQKTFDIIKTHRVDVDDPDSLDNMISWLRDAGYYKSMSDQSITALFDLYKKYDKILKEDNFVTYADQEPLMFKVLEMHPEYFEELGYKHIVVDEFQDSNEIQLETLKKLIDTKCFESLMVVGDDSQAIYAFRETTPEYIINFDKYIGKPVTSLFLTENRRSTPQIIGLSNSINSLNENRVDKDMVPTREDGQAPVVRGFYSKKEEYEYIVESIAKRVRNGQAPETIAFIASKKTELSEIGTMLTNEGIPWVMKNPMDLMANSRVFGALSLADAFYQPEATILYFNYLVAKYDGEILNMFTTSEINDMIADMKAEFETIYLRDMDEQKAIFHRYLEEIHKSSDDELYDYFLSLLYNNEDLQSELEYTRIFKKYGSKMAKKMDQSYEGVVLTTAHSSKGLEWPTVFISISNFDSERLHMKRHISELEEKRRLLFVATTRARDELYVTGQYVAYGPKDNRTYNQFLKELYDITGQDYQPIDPMESVRDAERKQKAREKQKERYATKKLENELKALLKGTKSSGSREMTKEEIEAYNKLAGSATQMSLFS